MRMLANQAKVDSMQIGGGDLDGVSMERVKQAAETLGKLPITIDDSSALSLIELSHRVKKAHMRNKCEVLFVDHLGKLARYPGAESEFDNISQNVAGLKNLAKDINIPVVLLIQLNRDVERRKVPLPMMSDLRGSGRIEEEADVIMMLYRASYYDKSDDGTTEILIEKNRDGKTGKVEIVFVPQYASFADKADDEKLF